MVFTDVCKQLFQTRTDLCQKIVQVWFQYAGDRQRKRDRSDLKRILE